MHDQNIGLTTNIVAAFLSNNVISANDVPSLIENVYSTVNRLGSVTITVPTPEAEPAVPVRKSVTPDAIICLQCGAKAKMLKRHLMTAHGMDEHEYRAKFRLPSDYPLTAPNYSAKRAELAKSIGLGRKPKGN